MASIIWADVVNFASELSTLDTDAQTDILAHVNSALNVTNWGGEDSPQLRLGRIYLAAHFGTVSAQGGLGVAGPVTQESAGGLSRSYAWSTAASELPYESTAYGKAFRALIRATAARAPVLL